MEKKITVYVVSASTTNKEGVKTPVEGGKSKIYPTKSTANVAVEILADFGVEVSIFPEKRVVTLA